MGTLTRHMAHRPIKQFVVESSCWLNFAHAPGHIGHTHTHMTEQQMAIAWPKDPQHNNDSH
eukprot:5836240-Lingulodinium_polyedra.AAC.1